MSKSDDRDGQSLNERFDDILNRLRPYLLNLTTSSDSRHCRSWLDRLNRADDQPVLRNDYLLELHRQLKDGYLTAPFNKLPGNSKLVPLTKSNHMVVQQVTSSSCNELTETSPSVHEHPEGWPLKPRSKSLQRDAVRRSKTFPRQLDLRTTDPYDTPSSPRIHFHDQTKRCERNLLRTYKNRLETLGTIVEELEAQNEKLKQKLKYYQNLSTSEAGPELHLRIKQLMSEITNLKNKLTEVHELKTVLEKHHKEIVEQYKIKMTEQFNSMKRQLENARCENDELNAKLSIIDENLKKLNNEKAESLKKNEEMWMYKLERTKVEYEKKLKEKDLLLEARDELVKEKEMELTQKLDEIESLCEQIKALQQLVELRSQDDGKLECILIDQHKNIMGELSKMRTNIEIASRQQTEIHQQEIAILKKNVQKFQKLAHKLHGEYEKQLYHIIKEQNREITELQMRYHNPALKLSNEYCNDESFEKNSKKLLNSIKTITDNPKSENLFQKILFKEDQISKYEKS